MGLLTAISNFFKLVLFFLDLWKEKDKIKSAEKAEIGKEIVDAFKEIDNDKKASKLNVIIGRINRMR